MNPLRYFVITTLSLLSLANGQKADEVKVSLKVDFVSWGEDLPGLTVDNKPVTALAFRYSKNLRYSGSQIVEISQIPGSKNPEPELSAEDKKLLKQVGSPAAPPVKSIDPAEIPPQILERRKENPNLVALAMIPANSKHVTILLAPGKGGTFETHVIDDDPAKLPFGQLRIYNFCTMPVALRCTGANPKELKPREAMFVAPTNQQVVYELAYKKDKEWQIQENNLLPIRADEQAQMIVLQSNSGFFTSSDGSRGGFLQKVVLRRRKEVDATPPQ